MKRRITVLSGIVLLAAGLAPLRAAGLKQEIAPWMMLGPLALPQAETRIFDTDKDLVRFHHLDPGQINPAADTPVQWGAPPHPRWRPYNEGNLAVNHASIYYMATWLDARRWLSARLLLDRVDYAFTVYLDGEAQQTSRVHADSWKVDMHLPTGRHLLVIKLLVRPQSVPRFLPKLEWSDEFGTVPLRISLDPQCHMEIKHVLNAAGVTNLQMAPDGRYVAAAFSRLEAGDVRARWLEILDADTGVSVWSSRGVGTVSGLAWLPDSSGFAFIRKHKDQGEILVHHLRDHSVTPVVRGITGLENLWWSPDNRYLVYAVADQPLRNKAWHQVRELADRAAVPSPRHRLYIHFLSGAVTRCLTRTRERFHGVRISPDGKQVLMERRVPDPSQRPYDRYEGVLLNPQTMERTPLLADPWINAVYWSPDSRHLLILGGPSAFKGKGNVLPEGVIPNDFDGQAYVMDITTQAVKPLSRDFNPSINSAFWHPDGRIYAQVVDGTRESLAEWREGKGFHLIPIPADVVHQVTWARKRPLAVVWASGVTTPQRLYRVDLRRGRSRMLRDENADLFRHVRLGKVEDRDFHTPEGRVIPGRLYYPPEFNPNRRYPLIVYYYGGTSPVSRDFGGRYPKNWYAAQGYMVYVLQPTGTVGYGQSASAVHVNDWGKHTAREIIAAVKDLADSHPNVDPRHIGAMGASYGGFLTQYLAASTDRFAAFISHAGIASLASYWGVGDWGVLYSGVASANSFPWNNKPLYVGQSPLFLADRIHTPLLLLHGDRDNNVPPGESYQMYAALKLLGRKVALVTFRDQQHFILDPPQRRRWMLTIIAWFDRWLKGEPQAWNHMYPEEKPGG